MKFSFYTTAKISKERKVGRLSKVEIPKNGLLKNIRDKDYNNENTLDKVIEIVLSELEKQEFKADLAYFKDVDNDFWESFFNCFEWNFNKNSEKELESDLSETIKFVPFYNSSYHAGFESFILKHIIDDLDQKQTRKDFFERILTTSDIELIFVKAERNKLKICDPSYMVFEDIEIEDKRNITEKIHTVNSSYPNKKINVLCRKIIMSKYEQKILKGDDSLISQICRIYDACDNFLASNSKQYVNYEDIDNEFEVLVQEATNSLNELSKTYKYPLLNKESIKNIVLDLFDRCYLDFNVGEIGDE